MRRRLVALLSVAALLASTAAIVRTQDAGSAFRCDSSSMTYRITHPLHAVEATSRNVEFQLAVDTLTHAITAVSGRVDVMTFDSGNSNRDSHAMEVIDALTYPDATFRSTGVVQRQDTLQVNGSLAFHGVTQPVQIHALSHSDMGELIVDGTFALSLTAFGIERPSMLMMPVEDTLRFTFHTAFHRR